MSEATLIHAAVAHRAELAPDALALIDKDERVSYAELDAASDALARHLRDRGVGRGSLVPVVLPRSAQLITVLLAVLKCGAAYTAWGTRWPQARLRALLAPLAPPLLVTRTPLPGITVPTWAPLNGSVRHWADAPTGGTPRAEVTGDDPATVFFTSGTSGSPKAVVSPHRATTRLTGATAVWAGPGRVMAQTAPASWDAFSLESWGTLTAGGTCAVAQDDRLLPSSLRALVGESGVDTVFLTTSLFHLFVEEDPGCFEGLRTVLTGGERLSPQVALRFLAAHPGTVLNNCYGPVESCVFASVHRVAPEDCTASDGIPLGTPVPETGIHVLHGTTPAAPGEVGEICVSGDGLAREYLGAPHLTARGFPVVPLSGVPTRVYRTGDYGHMDHQGVLHFKGRSDRQVKIAGHRVEPQEIEEAGRNVPGVRDCAVTGVPDAAGGDTRLALFYTCDTARGPDRPELTPAALRRELASRLPAHLAPHVVRQLPELPLTPNGKTDLVALPALLDAPVPTAAVNRIS